MLNAVLHAEIQSVYEFTAVRFDLGLDGHDLLSDALNDRIDKGLRRIFFLLDILHPSRTFDPVHHALQHDNAAIRTSAIELLDNLIDHRIRDLLIPLVDAPHERVVELGHRRFGIRPASRVEQLDRLSRDGDHWLRCCALVTIDALDIGELAATVDNARAANDPLVSETATVVARSMKERRVVDLTLSGNRSSIVNYKHV
jgi:hypothetical protein